MTQQEIDREVRLRDLGSPGHPAWERRLRRLADQQGYRISKLRNGDGYWLIDVDTGGLVIGEEVTRGVRIGYDLDVIEDWLCDRK
jgi:hypothetical protein